MAMLGFFCLYFSSSKPLIEQPHHPVNVHIIKAVSYYFEQNENALVHSMLFTTLSIAFVMLIKIYYSGFGSLRKSLNGY